mmetsp:Transcript_17405/g.22639  ORF Transcript_17405/g.22639 Transcript_17405/m.22639 type:complete len:331 (+) Transcript_17405:103-1095(+)
MLSNVFGRSGAAIARRMRWRGLASAQEVVLEKKLRPIEIESSLPESKIEEFEAMGAIMLPQILDSDWIEALQIAAENNMLNPGPLCDEHASAAGTSGRFHDDQFLWKRHQAMEQYVLYSGIGALAARAMRSTSCHIFYDQLLVKEPGTVAPTPWHNDTSYWQLQGSQICSVWLALDIVSANVGVAYVPASHHTKIRHAITNFSGADHSDKNTYFSGEAAQNSEFDQLPDIDALVEKGEISLLKWDMLPGDVIVFNSYAIHGAKGNPNKANRRRGYATRWCGDDVTFDSRPGTMQVGWDKAGYNGRLQHGQPYSQADPDIHPNVVPLYHQK